MSQILKIRKVLTLPGTLEASTLYMVKAADANHFELYVSTDDGSTARHIITEAEIQTKINNAIASFSSIEVVANIAARDALSPTVVKQVIVLDATGDTSVTSGSATYVYNTVNSTWIKVSESESMDVVLQWSNIQGKPTSTVADIDDAVTKRHTHANKAVLDNVSDIGGHLAYAGQPVRCYLEEESW